MNTKDKITNHQLLALAANGGIGGGIIVVAGLMASIAKQDAWIGALVTPVFGLPVIWMYWFLGSQYPGMTLVGIIKEILGDWLGLAVAFSFIVFCFTSASRVIWYAGSFITLQSLKETPIYIIDLLFIIAMTVAVLYGIETIARASELLMYFASTLFFLAMLLVLPKVNIENLQPVLEKGIMPIMKSSVFLSCFLTYPLITLLMIYPAHLPHVVPAKKALFQGYIWAALVNFVAIFMSILVLSSITTATSQSPTYFLSKEIEIGTVLTRLEVVITISWIATLFIIGTLFYYAGVIGFSQLLKLKDYTKIVPPLSLIILVMSWIAFPDSIYEAHWNTFVWTPFAITHGFILPVLLLIVFWLKKRKPSRERSCRQQG